MVSAESVLQAVTNVLIFLNAWIIYKKRPNHPLWTWFCSCNMLAAIGSNMYHVCAADDIAYCPRPLPSQLTLDTLYTYNAVAATFGPFYPVHIAGPYMLFMSLFSYFLVQVLYDSFWAIFVIVPVSSLPFMWFGQMKDVLRHPIRNYLHYISCAFGLGAVYFKWAAGDDPLASVYQRNHPLWHTFAATAAFTYALNQPAAEKSVTGYEKVELKEVTSPSTSGSNGW